MTPSLKFQPRFESLSKSSGFTLAELLIAAGMTSCALLLGGIGLSAMLSSSTAVTQSVERKDELNRAMDFISAELRETESINKVTERSNFVAAYTADIGTVPVEAASVKEILWFEVGPNKDKVVYYVGKPTVDNGPWKSPQVVYRWGPKFDQEGNYDNNVSEHSLLVDSIENQIDGGAEPSCASGWNEAIAPNIAKDLGFFACIGPNNKVANLIQVGRANQVLGKSEPISKGRQVYARIAETVSTPLPTPKPGNSPLIQPKDEDCTNNCMTKDRITQNLEKITLTNRGGSLTCGSNGPTVQTETTIRFNKPDGSIDERILRPNVKETFTDIEAGTEYSYKLVRQAAGRCRELTFDTIRPQHSQQFEILENGSRIPEYEPYDNQSKIQTYLSDKLVEDSNTVFLAENEMVFLFELGVTNKEHSAFDMQDLVIIAELTPDVKRKEVNVE